MYYHSWKSTGNITIVGIMDMVGTIEWLYDVGILQGYMRVGVGRYKDIRELEEIC